MDTGDDGGGGGDMADVMDPSLMDIDSAGGGMMGPGGMGGGPGAKLANLKVQTLLALQELGIVVAVAFMVGGIFMLMILLWAPMPADMGTLYGQVVQNLRFVRSLNPIVPLEQGGVRMV